MRAQHARAIARAMRPRHLSASPTTQPEDRHGRFYQVRLHLDEWHDDPVGRRAGARDRTRPPIRHWCIRRDAVVRHRRRSRDLPPRRAHEALCRIGQGVRDPAGLLGGAAVRRLARGAPRQQAGERLFPAARLLWIGQPQHRAEGMSGGGRDHRRAGAGVPSGRGARRPDDHLHRAAHRRLDATAGSQSVRALHQLGARDPGGRASRVRRCHSFEFQGATCQRRPGRICSWSRTERS